MFDRFRCGGSEIDILRGISILVSLLVSIPAWCLAAIYIPEIIAILFVLFILTYYFLVSCKHSLTNLPILLTIFSAFSLLVLIGMSTYYSFHPEKGFFCYGFRRINHDQISERFLFPNHARIRYSTEISLKVDDCGDKDRYVTFVCMLLVYAVINIFVVFLLYHLRFLSFRMESRRASNNQPKPPTLPTYEAALAASSDPPPVFYTIAPFSFPDDVENVGDRQQRKCHLYSLSQQPPPYSGEINRKLTAPPPYANHSSG